MIPRGKPLVCQYPNKHNDTFVTECCKEYDFCNQDLKPTLHNKSPGRVCHFIFNNCMDFQLNNRYVFLENKYIAFVNQNNVVIFILVSNLSYTLYRQLSIFICL